jgi:hypothetical protein
MLLTIDVGSFGWLRVGCFVKSRSKGLRMCNLYSAYSTQATMRKTFGVTRDNAGNLPPLPGIFPDQMAPIVRMADGERELLQMRWGFPPSPEGRHTTGYERAQRGLAVLARVAQAAISLLGASDFLFRICRYQAAQNAYLVRSEQG